MFAHDEIVDFFAWYVPWKRFLVIGSVLHLGHALPKSSSE